jgi:prepilin-type N-terminal cleavage/methylation domain-containing protein
VTKRLQKNLNSDGYTLIELLLVVGLLAISVGVTSDILLNLVRSYNRVQVFNEIEQQTNFIVQKLEKEVRNAEVAVHSADGKTLDLVAGGQDIRYQVSDAGVMTRTVTDGGSTSEVLNEAGNLGGIFIDCTLNTDFNGCFFTYPDRPIRVIYDLRVRQSQQGAFTSETGAIQIYNYIVLRRSY